MSLRNLLDATAATGNMRCPTERARRQTAQGSVLGLRQHALPHKTRAGNRTGEQSRGTDGHGGKQQF
jgi:hypothetical protein